MTKKKKSKPKKKPPSREPESDRRRGDSVLRPRFLDTIITKAAASTAAQLVKQRLQYLGKAPVFYGNTTHTLYGPLPALITGWDTWIQSVSWSGAGGLDEAVEIQDASGRTVWRAGAQAVDDSNFASVYLGRLVTGGYQVPVLDSGRLDVQIGRTLRNAPGGRSH